MAMTILHLFFFSLTLSDATKDSNLSDNPLIHGNRRTKLIFIYSFFIFYFSGVTPSLRPKIWRIALGLSADDRDESDSSHYQSLIQKCHDYDVMTDDLFLLDVQYVSNDHRFFPFIDGIKEIVLCFSRDDSEAVYDVHEAMRNPYNNSGSNNYDNSATTTTTTATTNSSSSSNTNSNSNSSSNTNDNTNNENVRCVQPFLGLTNYFAPLCYLYSNRSLLYSTASRMWNTIWCKLNVITSDKGTLLYVCKTFEDLLAFLDPKLFLHLLSLDVQPLRVAFSWLQIAFVGFFEIDQLLILWDRVLGFTDLTLFSLVATAIFISRTESLLLCTSKEKVFMILNEGSRLKVIPLLQMILFSEK